MLDQIGPYHLFFCKFVFQLTDYQEKYLETDKLLREKESSFLSAKDNADIITKLQAKIVSLEEELFDASQPKEDTKAKPGAQDVVEQQR